MKTTKKSRFQSRERERERERRIDTYIQRQRERVPSPTRLLIRSNSNVGQEADLMKGENTFTLEEGGPNKSRKRRVLPSYCQVWVNISKQ